MSQMMRSSKELRQKSPPPSPPPPSPPAEEQATPPVVPTAVAPTAAPVVTAPAGLSDAELYTQLLEASRSVYKAAATAAVPDLKAVTEVVRQVFARLQQGDNELLGETVRYRSQARSWSERGANTAVLSMRMGLELKYDERRTLGLGLCALMHDLGMLTMPTEVLDSPSLTPEQLKLLKRHPVESQRSVEAFGPALSWIGKIVVQVHERWNGSGYPHGLKGEQIHEMAGIIGLADTYEAMAHPRADRKALVVYNALKQIVDMSNTFFDRRLVRALIHIISIFPLGSLVQLNNGAIGRVVGTSKTHPTRPTLDLLIDPRQRRLATAQKLRLEEEPMLYIVEPAIDESTLEK